MVMKQIPVRLEMYQIEKLLEQKNPSGEPLFCKVHYLALSEKSRGKLYSDRSTIASIYGVECSADACRSAAVMGNEETSERCGSVMLRHIHEELTEQNTSRSPDFYNYDHDEEIDEPMLQDAAFNHIDEDVHGFIDSWNQVMGSPWSIDISDMELDEAHEHCKNTLIEFPAIISDELVKGLKKMYWKVFTMKKHEPDSFAKRTETFARIFAVGDRQPVQTCLPV